METAGESPRGRANQYINAARCSRGQSDVVPKAPSVFVSHRATRTTAPGTGDTGGLSAIGRALPTSTKLENELTGEMDATKTGSVF